MRSRLRSCFQSPLRGCAVVFALACLVAGLPARAAQKKQPEKPTDEKVKAEHTEFLDDAQHYTIRMTKPDAVLKLHEPAVLNFTNPERNQERGSVFVWLHEGRPAVMGQFFRYDWKDRRPKKHALHSLAAVALEGKFNDKLAWTPEEPGVKWKPFPEAPAVAATKKERLSQMKLLAQRVKINLIDPRAKDKPIELRRLERPLFEYAALKQGVTDGAIFSFVVATDPEAILLIEAFDEEKKTGFRYAFARFHFWRLTATLGDKPVWDVEYDPSMMNNPLGAPETMKKIYNSFVP